jgi:hypothetical protein
MIPESYRMVFRWGLGHESRFLRGAMISKVGGGIRRDENF